MKWKYLLATTALLRTIGTGFYYRKNRRKLLSRLETAGATENSAGLHAIGQPAYQQILAGKYDQKLDTLVQNSGRYFGKLEPEGRERLHTFYGQLGDKMNATLLKLRREICRGEVQNMARDIGQVLDKYQK